MSAAKKYLYDLSLPEKKEQNFKLIKNKKSSVAVFSKATLIMTTLIIFAAFMIITYRYNVISEKNLRVQQLKEDLEIAKSELATSQIALEQVMDVNYVESYAKQQLGMQKPEKSQLIYINMDGEDTVNRIEKETMMGRLTYKIQGFMQRIFN